MKNLSSLNKYLYKYRFRLLLGGFFIVLSNVFGVYSPQVVREAVDSVTTRIGYWDFFSSSTLAPVFLQTFSISILFFGITVVVLAIMRGIFLFFMRQTIIVMSRLIEYDQKNEIFTHYQHLDLDFYKRNNTGDLMSRITEDVSRVRMYTGPAIMYTLNLAVLVVMVIYTMLRVNVELTIYTITPLPVLGFTIYYVNGLIERKSEVIQRQLAFLTSIAQESFSGIKVIKSYVQEQFMNKYFTDESEVYKSKALELARIEAVFFPTIFILVGLSTLFTVFIGGTQVIEGKITAGNIAEFVIYINMLTWPIASVGWVMALVQRASASQKRIDEFLGTPSAIISSDAPPERIEGHIEFRNVTFTYPNTGITALSDVTFTARKGERIAVIGKTGSGKSTLGMLLTRMYDPQQGRVLIDGKDVHSIQLSSLRRQIGYVPQDSFLFSDTIRNNIAFGMESGEVNDDQVIEAARNASVLSDIESLPNKFDTVLGERGVTLSGGQIQRVSMARALIKNPNVMILDDCLSAVDAQTEQNILHSLNNFLAGKTTIIITHRIFSLLSFDKILVLHDGAIVEEGNHEFLMQQRGLYYELYEKQQMEESQTPAIP